MSLTFKQIADAVMGELGVAAQDQYFGNTSTQETRLTALANRAIKILGQEGYTSLKTLGTITMTSATTYDLPADFMYLVPDTMNADGQWRPINMPVTSQHWYQLQARHGIDGIRYKARIIGDQLEVNSPESGVDLIFEYLTKNVVQSTGSASPDKERFSKDTDTWLLDDDLLIMDLKWRFMQSLNLDWQTPLAELKAYKLRLRGLEGGSQTIQMGMGVSDPVVDPYYELYR